MLDHIGNLLNIIRPLVVLSCWFYCSLGGGAGGGISGGPGGGVGGKPGGGFGGGVGGGGGGG